MKKVSYYIVPLVIFLFTSSSLFSQGGTCNTSDPFCTGTTATFPGGVNQVSHRNRDIQHGAQHARKDVRVYKRAKVGRRELPLGVVGGVHSNVGTCRATRARCRGHHHHDVGRENGA